MTPLYLFILLPVTLAGILHMLVVRKKLAEGLAVPVAPRILGRNKTWRGMLFMPLCTALLSVLFSGLPEGQPAWESGLSGWWTGMAYVLAEWPNSWLKRRLGAAEGERPQGYTWGFIVVDKTDSALGVSWAAWYLYGLSFGQWAVVFIAGVGLHVALSLLLVRLGIKRSF
ncbi:hypothetical protein [Phaeodactylibacter luteus]|uniref:CDP-archaeol synthase n=1 Tax=Phaeodactylibacter luteus TaxID=1564516 RepID=A0A5C6RSK5_9BACT|nr:hypothetical protein [Phaeodactylibacter luteus]TXB64945.1 hypothetical protein FRY97_06895 [Phaeodactylibacter luteus]